MTRSRWGGSIGARVLQTGVLLLENARRDPLTERELRAYLTGLKGSVALVGRVHGVIAGRAQIRWRVRAQRRQW
jgi:hypothetical protein